MMNLLSWTLGCIAIGTSLYILVLVIYLLWSWKHDKEGIKMSDTTRYTKFPEHPLAKIRQTVLDAARQAMQGAAECGEVDSKMVNPIADMIVMDLLPWLKSEAFLN